MMHYRIVGEELGKIHIEPAKEIKGEDSGRTVTQLNFRLINGYAVVVSRQEKTIDVEV